ncbi:peptidylprolyl isomerase [Chitinivorax sp. B]|uniref:foldase protein PrsA n=1 Tax=Chitinivorax sp. B TaxID=2502235 RepID=UPI0010F8492F|nr:peptidylprolyl isomerase [Chitinivorax sp. B]
MHAIKAGMVAWLMGAVLIAPVGHAKTSHNLNEPGLAARINGSPIPASSVDVLWRYAQQRQDSISRDAVLDAMITNHLLASHARDRYQATTLFSASRVAFMPEVNNEDQLVGILRSVYGKVLDQAVKALPGNSLSGLIDTNTATLTPAKLEAILGKPVTTLQLDHDLNPEQQIRAGEAVVLAYRLPGQALRQITLLDVYRRQNVQGRVAIQQRQLDFILQQARTMLANQFVLHWATQQWGDKAVQHLLSTMDDQAYTQALSAQYGIGGDMHAPTPKLKAFEAKVTKADIHRYYQLHQFEFKRIERIKARHIRLRDEATAQAVYQTLKSGADFGAQARQHSVAADRETGGDLGWIDHAPDNGWLTQLAMMQTPNVPSPPVRTPVGPNDAAEWEIVLVEERIEGFHAPNSETVRYAAVSNVARLKAMESFMALRDRLKRTATIELTAGSVPTQP